MTIAQKKTIKHDDEAVRVRMGDFFAPGISKPSPSPELPSSSCGDEAEDLPRDSNESLIAERIEEAFTSRQPIYDLSVAPKGPDPQSSLIASWAANDVFTDWPDQAIERLKIWFFRRMVGYFLKSERVSLDQKADIWVWIIRSIDEPEHSEHFAFRNLAIEQDLIPEALIEKLLWYHRKQFIALFGRPAYEHYQELVAGTIDSMTGHVLCRESPLHLATRH